MKEKTIGITDCSKYETYHKWIAGETGVRVIKLSYHGANFDDIRRCDGVVLTGGGDVHPRFYNKMEYLERCDEIDEKRDDFEWRVLEFTEKNRLPLLGICRGLQIANVYFGGTLLPHIPDYGKLDHSKFGDVDRRHLVQVNPSSELRKIVTALSGEINSAHHQSADSIGKGLIANAFSPDGVVEGLERQNMKDGAFLLLVQWHPERMKNLENVFSKNIKARFLEAAQASGPHG